MDDRFEQLVEVLRKRVVQDARLVGLDILSVVQPSARLVARRASPDQLALGASRIGGFPDAPPNFAWPCWSRSGTASASYSGGAEPQTPLDFIAQIDLSAVPRLDGTLPRTGWLYFFYDRLGEAWGFDPADRGSCRVFYADCDRSNLNRVAPAPAADQDDGSHLCLIEVQLQLTLPDERPGIKYRSAAYAAYHELLDELGLTTGWLHRLLGHPQLVQGPMELECQLASNGIWCGGTERDQQEAAALAPGAQDWRLLLQIDTDEDGPGWMWGDAGRIYFWIKKQDLVARRFENVWLVFQCC